nr:hypothetical protein [Crucivirus sp.]
MLSADIPAPFGGGHPVRILSYFRTLRASRLARACVSHYAASARPGRNNIFAREYIRVATYANGPAPPMITGYVTSAIKMVYQSWCDMIWCARHWRHLQKL